MDIDCLNQSYFNKSNGFYPLNQDTSSKLDKTDKTDKIKVGKRVTPLDDFKDATSIKKKSINPFSLSMKQIEICIKARLLDSNNAIFQYENSLEECYLYKILTTKKKKHMYYLDNQNIPNLENIYGTPWDRVKFKFEAPKYTPAFDVNGQPCLLESCFGNLCEFNMKVSHYDFISPRMQRRKVGIVIRVSQIKCIE